MQKKSLRFGKGFRIAAEVHKAQGAEMVLAPCDGEGGQDNHHRGADQWMFVVDGTGVAIVDGRGAALTIGPFANRSCGSAENQQRTEGHGFDVPATCRTWAMSRADNGQLDRP